MRRYLIASFRRAALSVVGFATAMIVIAVAVALLDGIISLLK